MATAKFVLRTLPGIDRPAILASLPSMHGHTNVLDLGANVESTPRQLYQFAVMGSVLTAAVDNIPHPRVGLLNIGEEEMKGNERVRETAGEVPALFLVKPDGPTFAPIAQGLLSLAQLQERIALAASSQGWISEPDLQRTRPLVTDTRIDAPGLGVPDHVPNHECAETTPELAARYPLAMISPPARNFLNSSFVNVISLRAIEGEPLLEIHPDDAAARGIDDGQLVTVFNDRGRYRCKAAVTDRARPGVVHGLGIWWRKFGVDGTNVNELTHQRLTDIGRAPSFYDCLVEVA